MQKELLNELAKKATDLWMADRYEEARGYFEKVHPYIDPQHWNASEFHTRYALTLEKLGQTDEATQQFNAALSSAMLTDPPESISVTLARFGLAEHLYRNELYDKALMEIMPSLEIDCESKWLVLFLSAQIYYKQSKIEDFEQAISAVLFSAPKGKYKSVSQIRTLIINE